MKIIVAAVYPLSLSYLLVHGQEVSAPAEAAVVWNVEDSIEGKHAGTITADPTDPHKATLTGGDAGAEGVLTVSVTLADGFKLTGASVPLLVTDPDPAEVVINIGAPDAS